MTKHTRITFVVSAVVLALLLPSPAGAVVTWELTDDAVSLGMNGASPHVEKTASGDRVWRSDMVPAGTAVSLCTDAGVCATETLTVSGGGVSDFTIAQTTSGLRAFFKRTDPSSNTQGVYSAACADTTCLTLGTATLTTTEMRVSKDQKAWGVPDAVRMPDGRIRIYNVETGSTGTKGGSCPEKVASYISSDGISFTREAGWRLEGGYVDTEVLRAKDGEWVMILADGPGCTTASGAPKVQQLFVTTSSDGLTWATPQVVTAANIGRLDPTGYEVSTNVFRIYYAAGGAGAFDPNAVYTIKRATLRIKQGSGEVEATSKPTTGKKTSITCTKGKTTRKVTGVNPKCPKGFTKK